LGTWKKNKKTGPLKSACWAFLLVAWNFYFQSCLSPVLAWANCKGAQTLGHSGLIPPIINQGYLFFCFILISWGCFTSPFCFFIFLAMSQFHWPIAKKCWNQGGPQNRRFYGKMECLPLSFGPAI
jgi:hypothetical protein